MSRFLGGLENEIVYSNLPHISKQTKVSLIKKLTVLIVISLHVSYHYYLNGYIMC